MFESMCNVHATDTYIIIICFIILNIPNLHKITNSREIFLLSIIVSFLLTNMVDGYDRQRFLSMSSRLSGDSCFVAESEQKWQDLQATESKRRALLKRTGDSFFSILFSYEGTFWRIMAKDMLLWFTIGVYIVLRLVTHHSGILFEISSNQMGALGAVMT